MLSGFETSTKNRMTFEKAYWISNCFFKIRLLRMGLFFNISAYILLLIHTTGFLCCGYYLRKFWSNREHIFISVRTFVEFLSCFSEYWHVFKLLCEPEKTPETHSRVCDGHNGRSDHSIPLWAQILLMPTSVFFSIFSSGIMERNEWSWNGKNS